MTLPAAFRFSSRRLRCWVGSLAILSIACATLGDVVAQDSGPESQVETPASSPLTGEWVETIESQLSQRNFNAEHAVAASGWLAGSGVTDWLGPLAPLAISPFFGVACLSGMALWGPESVASNALLGSTGPLKNEWLFGIFVVLTLITSLPRMTKISKPLAQAIDQLETYSVIVILIAIKLVAMMDSPTSQPPAMIQMGLLSVSVDVLLIVAMLVNIVVINSVKFFFEFLVWLTPIPFLDMVFELSSKAFCASLMLVYAMSPTLATVINLCLLLFAAIVFRWVHRQIKFYRAISLDPIIVRLWPAYATREKDAMIVFCKRKLGSFPAKSRLVLTTGSAGELPGWKLSDRTWWRRERSMELAADHQFKLRKGWFMNTVVSSDGETELIFSRRYDAVLPELAAALNLVIPEETEESSEGRWLDRLTGEFALIR